MKMLFSKTILVALVAALAAAALPFVSVSAAGEDVLPQGQVANERLERVWARQLRIYERLGQGFERDEAFTGKVQQLIERAEENGKDVSAVQAALDAFEAALKGAQPIYESASEIVSSHKGFDSAGKVTDPEDARETVKAMRAKFDEIKAAIQGTGRALHEVLKSFREANPRPLEPATP